MIAIVLDERKFNGVRMHVVGYERGKTLQKKKTTFSKKTTF